MAAPATLAEIAVQARIDPADPKLAAIVPGAGEAFAARIGKSPVPAAVQRQAFIAYVAWLFDAPTSPGGYQWQNAWTASGAASMVRPFLLRRAGSLPDAGGEGAAAPAAPGAGVDESAVNELIRRGVLDWAQEGNTDPIPAEKLGAAGRAGQWYVFTTGDATVTVAEIQAGWSADFGQTVTVAGHEDTTPIILGIAWPTSWGEPEWLLGGTRLDTFGSETRHQVAGTDYTVRLRGADRGASASRIEGQRFLLIWEPTAFGPPGGLLPEGGVDGQFLGRESGSPAWLAPPSGGGGGAPAAVPDGAITTAKIADGAVTTAKIKALAVTVLKLSAAVVARLLPAGGVDGQFLGRASGSPSWVAAPSGGGAALDDDAVTTDHIRNFAVTADKLATDAVVERTIAEDAVTDVQIKPNSVGTSHIAALRVTAEKLAADAVTTPKIKDGAVTTAKIGVRAVNRDNINLTAVTSSKLSADVVARLLPAGGADGQFLSRLSGSPRWVAAPSGGAQPQPQPAGGFDLSRFPDSNFQGAVDIGGDVNNDYNMPATATTGLFVAKGTYTGAANRSKQIRLPDSPDGARIYMSLYISVTSGGVWFQINLAANIQDRTRRVVGISLGGDLRSPPAMFRAYKATSGTRYFTCVSRVASAGPGSVIKQWFVLPGWI